MHPCPFWTFWLSPNQKSVSTPLFTESPARLIFIGSGIATIAAKYSVMNTLHHRARAVCSNPQLLQKEEHLQRVLDKMQVPCMDSQQHEIEDHSPNQSGQKQNKAPKPVPVLHPTIRGLTWLFHTPKG